MDKNKLFITNTGKYLDDYINVIEKDDSNKKYDMIWNLISEPTIENKSLDEIYVNNFVEKIEYGNDFLRVMLYNFLQILKPDGILRLGCGEDFEQNKKIKAALKDYEFNNVEICKYDQTVYPAKTTKPPVKKGLSKLHLGCGTKYFEDWINIDNNSDNNIQRLDINFDLRNPLPFNENSVDYIFNEHFLEHLTVEESRRALLDFRRVLKPTGKIRIAVPGLEGVLNLYNDPNWKEAPVMKTFGFDKIIKTRAEMLNINFRAWGHKWLYDREELERRLKECGFGNIKFCKIRESSDPNLQNLETRDESDLIAEAKKIDFDNTTFTDVV